MALDKFTQVTKSGIVTTIQFECTSVKATGVVTATSFSGSGANLTGIAATDYVVSNTIKVLGVSTFVGNAQFDGTVSIGGTLTYEDVTNIDSVGLITARAGVVDNTLTTGRVVYAGSNKRLTDASNFLFDGSELKVGTGITISSTAGVITATSYYGSGANLTGISAGTSLSGSTNNTICTVTGANAITGEANLTFDGSELSVVGDITTGSATDAQIKINTTGSLATYVQRAGDGVWGLWSPEFNFNVTNSSPGGTTFGQFGNHNNGHNITFVKSRNNGTSGTTVQAGDDLGSIFWSPYNSANPGCAAAVKVMADTGTWSSTSNPGYMQIMTAASGDKNPTERMRIQSGGNVGIGTTNPQQQLHVTDDTAYKGILINGNNAPSICFATSTNTTPAWKVGIPGTNSAWFGISTGDANTNKFLMNASGLSGFGHLPDTERLTVNGAQRWTYQSNNWGTGAEGAFIDYYAGGSQVRIGHANGASGSAKHIAFYSGGNEKLRILSTATVGVGDVGANTPTTAALYVNKTGSGVQRQLHLQNRQSEADDVGTSIYFQGLSNNLGELKAQFTNASAGNSHLILYAASGGGLTELGSWDGPSKNLNVNGNIKIATSGKGIDFSATANAPENSPTTTSELFDDYEEGSWTPVLMGVSSAGTGTYADTWGSYTRIGRVVYLSFRLYQSAHTGSGGLRLGGFPYTAVTSNGQATSTSNGNHSVGSVDGESVSLSKNKISAQLENGNTRMRIMQSDGELAWVNVENGQMWLNGTIWYETN